MRRDRHRTGIGAKVRRKNRRVACPKCLRGPMVPRRRVRDGHPFFGCNFYPKCNGTRPAPAFVLPLYVIRRMEDRELRESLTAYADADDRWNAARVAREVLRRRMYR